MGWVEQECVCWQPWRPVLLSAHDNWLADDLHAAVRSAAFRLAGAASALVGGRRVAGCRDARLSYPLEPGDWCSLALCLDASAGGGDLYWYSGAFVLAKMEQTRRHLAWTYLSGVGL